MNNSVSVIVPVFNTEKYLAKCIDSILCQSYRNFEVILVDDGSPDNCGKICDEYAQRDSRIKVLHRTNEGVSGARNAALDAATGDFVTFVDSDDTLPSDALEKLISAQQNTSADMVGGTMAAVKGKKVYPVQGFSGVFCGDEIPVHLFDIYSASPVSCCKLFKRSIIENENIRFIKNVHFAEDTYFFMQYVHSSQKLVFISDVTYFYNRANYHSATSKFYIFCDKYNEYNFEKIKEIIDLSSMSDGRKKYVLSLFADKMCCEIINHYMINLHSHKILREKIFDTVNYYRSFAGWNFSEASNMNISQKATDALKSGDIDGFITVWRRDNRVARIRHRIKIILVRLKLV